MLHDLSTDTRYIRRYDPKTGQIHIWRRGTPIPVSEGTRGENAMDWDEVFGNKEKKHAQNDLAP